VLPFRKQSTERVSCCSFLSGELARPDLSPCLRSTPVFGWQARGIFDAGLACPRADMILVPVFPASKLPPLSSGESVETGKSGKAGKLLPSCVSCRLCSCAKFASSCPLPCLFSVSLLLVSFLGMESVQPAARCRFFFAVKLDPARLVLFSCFTFARLRVSNWEGVENVESNGTWHGAFCLVWADLSLLASPCLVSPLPTRESGERGESVASGKPAMLGCVSQSSFAFP
jgi:hypothetical protein